MKKPIKFKIIAPIVSIAALTPAWVSVITSCSKKEEIQEIDVAEGEEKYKEPAAGVLEVSYRFTLKYTDTVNNFSVSVINPETSGICEELEASVDKIENKELTCKVKWKQEHIANRLCSFNLRFDNSKSGWSRDVVGFSFQYTSNKTISEISVVDGSFKKEYNYGDELDLTGLKVKIVESETGNEEIIDQGFSTEPEEGAVLSHDNTQLKVLYTPAGQQTITNTTPLTINAIITSTSFYSPKSFKVGEYVHRDDIVANGIYSDGRTVSIIDECVFPEIDNPHGASIIQPGTQTFNVQWKQDPKVAKQFALITKEGPLANIEVKLKDPSKIYAVNDYIKADEFEVTGMYPSGKTVTLTDYSTNPSDLMTEQGHKLTQVGENTFTFTYVTAESQTHTAQIKVNVIQPVLDSIIVENVRSWYHNEWMVALSDFTVWANFTNMEPRKISYDATGANGFKTEPAADDVREWNVAGKTPKITFKYTFNGVEKTLDYNIVCGNNKLTGIEPHLLKDHFNVGEKIEQSHIVVLARFENIQDAQVMPYCWGDKQRYSWHTTPELPYQYKPEDAGVGKRSLIVKTKGPAPWYDVEIKDMITVTNSDIAEIVAYPRVSEQKYVGQEINRSDIVVDEIYKNGNIRKDIDDWTSDEDFPITLKDYDVPSRVIKINRLDWTCECHIPVWKQTGEEEVKVDPTYVGTIQGKSIATIKVQIGELWKDAKAKLTDDYIPTIIDNKNGSRKFGYWSLSDSYDEIDDNYAFHGGEIITARYKDEVNLDRCIVLNSPEQDSKITFKELDLNNNILYSIDGDKWVKATIDESVVIEKQKPFYIRGDNANTLLPGTNFVIEGCVHITGRLNSLFDGAFKNCEEFDDKYQKHQFEGLFKNSMGLASLPDNFLSSIKLNDYCYKEMFAGCTSLFTHPDLAGFRSNNMIFFDGLYESMFEGCTNLTYIPPRLTSFFEFRGYVVRPNFMKKMYKDCHALTQVMQINLDYVVSLEPSCFEETFANCYCCAAFKEGETRKHKTNYIIKIPKAFGTQSEVYAKNMFVYKGAAYTPSTDVNYYSIAQTKMVGNDRPYTLVPHEIKYFQESQKSRKDREEYEKTPALDINRFSTDDINNEWHNSNDIYNAQNYIVGNQIVHEAFKSNDNYRQVLHKMQFSIILNPNEGIQLNLSLKFDFWAHCGMTFLDTNNNHVGTEIYYKDQVNYSPAIIGDAYRKTWRYRHDDDGIFFEQIDENKFFPGDTTGTATFNFSKRFVNETPFAQQYTLYFFITDGVDGNLLPGTSGDKRGSVNTFVNFTAIDLN